MKGNLLSFPSAGQDVSRVSPREAAVLDSLIEKWSDAEIAGALNVAETCVSRVRSIADASDAEIAMRLGLPVKTVAQIVSMFGARITNYDIAARLGIATDTVRAHLRFASAKLGVRGRRDLAAYWESQQQYSLRKRRTA